jgi:hypothetical protein
VVEAEMSEDAGYYVEFRGAPPKVQVRRIMEAVCAQRGISLGELTAPGRTDFPAKSRQMVMWLADRLRPDLSYLTIARMLGRTDHTTVMWGVRRIERLIAKGDNAVINGLVNVCGRLGIERVDMTSEKTCRLTETARAERDMRRGKGWNTNRSQTQTT